MLVVSDESSSQMALQSFVSYNEKKLAAPKATTRPISVDNNQQKVEIVNHDGTDANVDPLEKTNLPQWIKGKTSGCAAFSHEGKSIIALTRTKRNYRVL
jgi:hypothetical protein